MAHRTGLAKFAVATALLGLPWISLLGPTRSTELWTEPAPPSPIEPTITAEQLERRALSTEAAEAPHQRAGGPRHGTIADANVDPARAAKIHELPTRLEGVRPANERAKLLSAPSVKPRSKFLPIAPKFQQTPVWCWLAVGEMVFSHFAVPAVNSSFQCGIVAADSIATNMDMCSRDCSLCNLPVGTAREFAGMLVDYPRRAAALTGKKTPRVFAAISGVLAIDAVVGEIDRGNPVVAGISPGGVSGTFQTSAHVALIVGYELSEDKKASPPRLRVNDPFPFPEAANPYLAAGASSPAAGSYALPYETFERSLGWTESFLVRVEGEHDPLESAPTARASASRCVTPAGVKCEMRVDAPAGSGCFCLVPPGEVLSGVVQGR